MPMRVIVPFHSYETLKRRSETFLRKYNPTAKIPVPIEEIIEFDFKINIIPIPGLHQGFDIDGFTSSDLSTISVDEFVYESRPGRYRFTLAHELGHVILHHKISRLVKFTNIKDWTKFIKGFDVRDYGWLEWQAYAFAGFVLVPPDQLKKKAIDAIHRALKAGFSIHKEHDVAKMYISEWLAKQFSVSTQVIEKRLEKDKFWTNLKRKEK